MTLPQPGLWPRMSPRYSESRAEVKLFDIIRKQLPKGWYAWHSLSIRRENYGNFGEMDFLIAIKNRPAIIALEVKGGRIEQRDGQWFQNGKMRVPSPLDQSLRFRKLLQGRLREKGLTTKQIPNIGLAFCFPDTPFLVQPSQDGMSGAVLGAETIPYFHEAIRQVVGVVTPKPTPVKDDSWISLIHEIWGETWTPELDVQSKVKYDESIRIKLDQDQLSVLQSLDENFERTIVNGPAGSGKTILAHKAALNKANAGAQVLFVCYTEALGFLLKKISQHPNITAGPIRQFAIELLKKAGQDVEIENSSEFWESLPLRAAVDGLPDVEERWDWVIVDEGQDLTGADWDLVGECARRSDKILVFADETQSFWSDRRIPQIGAQNWYRFNLIKTYRCPPSIQNLCSCYAGYCTMDHQTINEGIQDGTIKLVESSDAQIYSNIRAEIDMLLSEGIAPNQIAIISIKGKDRAGNIMNYTNRLSGLNIVEATDADADKNIVCDTFLRFKGLQRPAIIVTDLRLVSNKFYDIRMHLAVSRAQSLLRIITGPEELKKDDRLSAFI